MLIVTVVTGLSCFFSAPNEARAAEIRNVVLITINSCRADHLGCYGDRRQLTPELDALAADAVLFERAHSTCPISLPAHSSLFTGTYPPRHGVRDRLAHLLDDSNVTLAETLREHGFQTAAFVGAYPLGSEYGIAQGFGTYDEQFAQNPDEGTPGELRAEDVSRKATKWLDAHGSKRFFLFLHYFDPHAPYAPPEPYASRHAERPYDGELAYADSCIGQVIAKLKSSGLYDSTLLIITADHAESLGEHDEVSHDYFIYQSTIQVPLIVKAPGGAKGARIDAPVSIVDVAPTVLGLLSIPSPSEVQGKDLSRTLLRGDAPEGERYLYCESFTPSLYGFSPLIGSVHEGWKYIWSPKPELYDLRRDPAEIRNVVAENREVAQKLQNRLRELGAPEIDPRGEDAKDHIGSYERLMRASTLVGMGQFAAARTECLEILKQPRVNPITAEATVLLADIAANERRYDEAVTYFSRYLENARAARHTDEQIAIVHSRLAYLFMSMRKAEEGVHHFRQAQKLNPQSAQAHADLGNALMAQGNLKEGIKHSQEALRLNPELPKVHYHLGLAFSQQGNQEEAVWHLQQAVRLGGDLPQVHYQLGAALAKSGKLEEAVDHYERAIELKPDDGKTYHALGTALKKLGRDDEARKQFLKAGNMDSRNPAAMNRMAWAQATAPDVGGRDRSVAVVLAEAAARMTRYQDAKILDTLAAAYAATDRFEEAVATAEKAVKLARDEELADGIRARLKLYKQSKPYREPPGSDTRR